MDEATGGTPSTAEYKPTPEERVEAVRQTLDQEITPDTTGSETGNLLDDRTYWNNLRTQILFALREGVVGDATHDEPLDTKAGLNGRSINDLRRDIVSVIDELGFEKGDILTRLFDDSPGDEIRVQDFWRFYEERLKFLREQVFPVWEKLVLERGYPPKNF